MARAKIMVVDDERMIRWSIQQALIRDGHGVVTAETGEEALAQATDEMPDLVFLDITLPGIDGIEVLRRLKGFDPAVSVVMVTANEGLQTAVESMRLGACDYISKPFDLDRLRVVARNALDRREMRQEIEFHRREAVRRYGFHRFVGRSPGMREVLDVAARVARSDAATVLIQGESGTGKDLLAQAIHNESARAARPFIPINCTALPEELLESELMGHERGAFTDAKSTKKGLFELADGGTVFLDEIGDMKPGLQAKILRFLESRTFRRVGGSRDIAVDVRIVAATNRNLRDLVRSGAFREDLYFRLNVVPVVIPPLRERREDILPLAEHYLAEYARECGRTVRGFTERGRAAMVAYDWPGNVREMKNLIEREMILSDGELLDPSASITASGGASVRRETGRGEEAPILSAPSGTGPPGEDDGAPPDAGGGTTAAPARDLRTHYPLLDGGVDLEELEKCLIGQALERERGNQTRAAQLLRLTRDALRYRMKKHGLLE